MVFTTAEPTTAEPTTAVFGLCTRKWRIFALEGDPPTITRILLSTVFFKSQNLRKAGTFCIQTLAFK